MLTYQKYTFFLNRYEHLVYTETAKNLFSYVVYPLCRGKDKTRGPQDNYKNYDSADIGQLIVNGQIVVPDGPYKINTYHVPNNDKTDFILKTDKIGPSQFENFVAIIKHYCENYFPTLIESYITNDKFSSWNREPPLDSNKVCALKLTEKLKELWKLK